jgi:hypothetical protein
MANGPENQKLTEEETREHSEDLQKAIDAIGNADEVRSIELLLSRDGPITWQDIQNTVLNRRTQKEQMNLFYINDTMGFPSEQDVPITTVLMGPKDVRTDLEEGFINARNPSFQNELALFQVSPDYRPGDPMNDHDDFNKVGYAKHPARIRFRELFPHLYFAVYEVAQDQEMTSYYAHLTDDIEDNRTDLTLFTMADQLMQRLVRPGDNDYASALEKQRGKNRALLPRYESVVSERNPKITNAREYLKT